MTEERGDESVSAFDMWVEVPAIRAETRQLPGMVFRGIRDLGAPGEPSPEVILEIPHKGRIAFYELSRASFHGHGALVIGGIGPCSRTPVRSVADESSQFDDLRFRSVAEVLAHDDAIAQRSQASGHCVVADERGPGPTQP